MRFINPKGVTLLQPASSVRDPLKVRDPTRRLVCDRTNQVIKLGHFEEPGRVMKSLCGLPGLHFSHSHDGVFDRRRFRLLKRIPVGSTSLPWPKTKKTSSR